jgi:uncharacterized membrane protein
MTSARPSRGADDDTSTAHGSPPPGATEAGGPAGVLDETAQEVEALEEEERQKEPAQNRVAHRITEATGSMGFVIANVVFFTAWIVLNLPGMPTQFDEFPFAFLTMIVSLEAILLSVFVLMSENAQARHSDRRARVDMQVNILAERGITRLMTLVKDIHEHLGLEPREVEDVEEMERTTRLTRVAKAVDAASIGDSTSTPPPGADKLEAEHEPRPDPANARRQP